MNLSEFIAYENWRETNDIAQTKSLERWSIHLSKLNNKQKDSILKPAEKKAKIIFKEMR